MSSYFSRETLCSKWDVKALRECAALNCRLTNPSENTQDAVSVYVTAVHALLNGATAQVLLLKSKKTFFHLSS